VPFGEGDTPVKEVLRMPKPHDDLRKLSPTYEWVRIVHGLDKKTPPPEMVREARRCYLAMCTWLDEKVG
jgi:hypothetical protein